MSPSGADEPAWPAPECNRQVEEGGYFDRANPYLANMLDADHRRILEVGCGAAALGGSWKAADPSRVVWGLEVDSAAAAVAASRIDRVLRVDLDHLTELPAPVGGFDLITFGDVLEHLRDPGRLIRLLSLYLAPAGEIIACVPNVGHWSVVTQLLRGRFDYEAQGLLDRTHIHLFTPSTFAELLVDCGLGAVTAVRAIMAPNPVSEQLAQIGAALAGECGSLASLHRSLDTYQVVFRARKPLRGPVTRFVMIADQSSNGTLDAVRAFRAGFRRGEPVHLTVLTDDPEGGLAELLSAGDELPRPHVETVSRSAGMDNRGQVQLPPGPDRMVTVGASAASLFPGYPNCEPTRLAMLRATYPTNN